MTTIEKQLSSILMQITSSGLRVEELKEIIAVIENRIKYLESQK